MVWHGYGIAGVCHCMTWYGRGMAWHIMVGVWYGMAGVWYGIA